MLSERVQHPNREWRHTGEKKIEGDDYYDECGKTVCVVRQVAHREGRGREERVTMVSREK